ncbi:substrate-binding domain-containing protein [Tessaracoccus terricola]
MNQLAESRRSQILAELRLHGMLRVTELSEMLGVAPVTIRRDINQLAKDGLLRRVHGGAAVDREEPDGATDETPVRQPEASFAVGMLVPSLDYYWPEIIQGAQDEAAERGLRLMLRGTSYDSTDDRAQVAHLLDSGVGGLILAPDVTTESTADLLEWLEERRTPFVLVEREAFQRGSRDPVEAVNTDHVAGAGAAVRHLVGMGHERIGLVTSLGSPHSGEIHRGWQEALATTGLDQDLPVVSTNRDGALGFDPPISDVVRQCLDAGCTALLVHADREAIAIVQHCQKQGVRVPEDLSVVAYDDEVASLFSPALTAVRPPRNSIGRAVVGLIAERLRDPDRPTHRVVISPKLHVRRTSVAPGGGAAAAVAD